MLILTAENDYSSLQRQKVTFSKGGLRAGAVVSKNGFVMTAAHVIQMADSVVVMFVDGGMVGAKVVGSAPQADAALLQLNQLPDNLAVTVTLQFP